MKPWIVGGVTLLLSGCATMEKQAVVKQESVAEPQIIQSQNFGQYSNRFLYLASQSAMQEGDVNLAGQFLTVLNTRLNASEDEKWMIEPRLDLAQIHLQFKRAKQAESLLMPLLAHYPVDQESDVAVLALHTLYARVQASLGQVDDALDGLTQLLSQRPDFMVARKLQVGLFVQMRKWDLAHIALDTAIQLNDSAELRKLEADAYLGEKKYDQALLSLQKMRVFAPDDPAPMLLQSQVEAQRGRMDAAEGYLRGFIETHPEQLLVQNALASLLMQSGGVEEAVAIYQRIMKAMPDRPEIPSALGILFYQKRDFKSALGYFERAFAIHAKGDGYAFYLAATLDALGEQAKAEALYGQVLEEDSLWSEAQLRLASREFSEKKWGDAEKRLHKVLKKSAENDHAWILLSAIYLNQKKYQKLLDQTESAAQQANPSARLMLNRAIAFEHFKRYDSVEKTLLQVIDAHPKDSEALNFLGYTYAEQGVKLHAAEAYIQRALVEKPKDGYYLDSLAWVYYQRGEYARAIQVQEQSLKYVPDDPMIQEHLGDMLWKDGRHDAAIAQWQRALAMDSERATFLQHKIKHGLK